MALELTQNEKGFANAQEMTAEAKLVAIKSTMGKTGVSSITFTGHSLGECETQTEL